MKKIILFSVLTSVCNLSNGQSLTHPHVWVKMLRNKFSLMKSLRIPGLQTDKDTETR